MTKFLVALVFVFSVSSFGIAGTFLTNPRDLRLVNVRILAERRGHTAGGDGEHAGDGPAVGAGPGGAARRRDDRWHARQVADVGANQPRRPGVARVLLEVDRRADPDRSVAHHDAGELEHHLGQPLAEVQHRLLRPAAESPRPQWRSRRARPRSRRTTSQDGV